MNSRTTSIPGSKAQPWCPSTRITFRRTRLTTLRCHQTLTRQKSYFRFQPLWEIGKSIGMMKFPIYENRKNVPKHQPVMDDSTKNRNVWMIFQPARFDDWLIFHPQNRSMEKKHEIQGLHWPETWENTSIQCHHWPWPGESMRKFRKNIKQIPSNHIIWYTGKITSMENYVFFSMENLSSGNWT